MKSVSNLIVLAVIITAALVGNADCLSCLFMEVPCPDKMMVRTVQATDIRKINEEPRSGCSACHSEESEERKCSCSEFVKMKFLFVDSTTPSFILAQSSSNDFDQDSSRAVLNGLLVSDNKKLSKPSFSLYRDTLSLHHSDTSIFILNAQLII